MMPGSLHLSLVSCLLLLLSCRRDFLFDLPDCRREGGGELVLAVFFDGD